VFMGWLEEMPLGQSIWKFKLSLLTNSFDSNVLLLAMLYDYVRITERCYFRDVNGLRIASFVRWD
jgi:hypothetical protein